MFLQFAIYGCIILDDESLTLIRYLNGSLCGQAEKKVLPLTNHIIYTNAKIHPEVIQR